MNTLNKTSSALTEYQHLLAWLLDHCYGLELNDTPYHDDQVIAQQIEDGISVRDTVNDLVEKCDRVRIDRPGFSLMAQDPTCHVEDMLRASLAVGVLRIQGFNDEKPHT